MKKRLWAKKYFRKIKKSQRKKLLVRIRSKSRRMTFNHSLCCIKKYNRNFLHWEGFEYYDNILSFLLLIISMAWFIVIVLKSGQQYFQKKFSESIFDYLGGLETDKKLRREYKPEENFKNLPFRYTPIEVSYLCDFDVKGIQTVLKEVRYKIFLWLFKKGLLLVFFLIIFGNFFFLPLFQTVRFYASTLNIENCYLESSFIFKIFESLIQSLIFFNGMFICSLISIRYELQKIHSNNIPHRGRIIFYLLKKSFIFGCIFLFLSLIFFNLMRLVYLNFPLSTMKFDFISTQTQVVLKYLYYFWIIGKNFSIRFDFLMSDASLKNSSKYYTMKNSLKDKYIISKKNFQKLYKTMITDYQRVEMNHVSGKGFASSPAKVSKKICKDKQKYHCKEVMRNHIKKLSKGQKILIANKLHLKLGQRKKANNTFFHDLANDAIISGIHETISQKSIDAETEIKSNIINIEKQKFQRIIFTKGINLFFLRLLLIYWLLNIIFNILLNLVNVYLDTRNITEKDEGLVAFKCDIMSAPFYLQTIEATFGAILNFLFVKKTSLFGTELAR